MKSQRDKWLQVFADCESSGMSAKDYCASHGINYGTYKTAKCKHKPAGMYHQAARTQSVWDNLICEYAKCDDTARDFANEHNLNYYTFTSKLREYGIPTHRSTYTFEEWETFNLEYEESSVSVAEYCHEHKLNYKTFRFMRQCILNKRKVFKILEQCGIHDKEGAVKDIVSCYHSRHKTAMRHRYDVAYKYIVPWLQSNGYVR